MKKIFLFAAACVALAACNQEAGKVAVESPKTGEISVMSVMGTKGYVEGATFLDTPYDKLHDSYSPAAPGDARVMNISAYLVPQAGLEGNYFVDYTYKYSDTDQKWHNFVGDVLTPIYWPLGGQMSFLAVSATKAGFDDILSFDSENAASKVVLDVTEEYSQDDILFSSVDAKKIGAGVDGNVVPMVFKHSQAWIEFVLSADVADVITINKIELVDSYKKGELTVVNNLGDALATWSFRNETREDLEMDDTRSVYGTALTTTDVYMDMLIPEQPKNDIVITYTLAGQGNVLTYRIPQAHENWLMGMKYVYDIDFSLNEIIVSPTVKPFADDNTTINPR